MGEKLEISIEIIAHATEDIKKILNSLQESFGISEDFFDEQNLSGHFKNPITLLNAKISKKEAKSFLGKFKNQVPEDEMKDLLEDIENHIQNSTLHVRIGKQEIIKGNLTFQEKDVIKLKIFSPSYNKKNVVKNYVELLTKSN